MKKINKKIIMTLMYLLFITTNISYAADVIWAPRSEFETAQSASSVRELPNETMKIYAPTAENIISGGTDVYNPNVAPAEIINDAVLVAESIDNENVYNVVENSNSLICYNPDGTMVKNGWRKINIHSFAQIAPVTSRHGNYVWMYFGSNGRAVKGGSTIRKYKIGDKTYAFNEYGEMLVGFFNNAGDVWEEGNDEGPFDLISGDSDDLYFANGAGELQGGWLRVENTKEELYPNKVFLWLYFKPDSYKLVRSTGNNYKSEKINGKTYAFDDLGIMLTGFEAYNYNEAHGGNTSKVVYFADDGHEITGGFVNVDIWDDTQSYFVEDLDDEMYDDEDVIVYMNKTGKMYRDEMRKIGSYYYGFDDNGVLVRGLSVWNGRSFVATINTDDTNGKDFIISGNYRDKRGNNNSLGSGEKVYYFDSNGRRQGSAIIDFSDETYSYSGNNNGGYNGSENKKYYANGILIKPMDEKYGVIVRNKTKTNYTMQEICNSSAVVVTSSGQVVSGNSAHKDDNDYYWLTQNGSLLNVYNVNVRYRSGKYEFRSESTRGKEEWIPFGEKDYFGRTCVLPVTNNGTRLENGAVASYQVKIERASALNFYLS